MFGLIEDGESKRAAENLDRLFQKANQDIERDLQKDRPRLFRALEEFANIRSDDQAWTHFKKRYPRFFPEGEYDRAERGVLPSVREFPRWLSEIWLGNTLPTVTLLLGIKPEVHKSVPIPRIRHIPAQFWVNWYEGTLQYRGMCMFQRALYLLLRESWRARICENCDGKFIARRAAQKYCSSDCSQNAQRELKRTWWATHGEEWRRKRNTLKSKRKRDRNGTDKAR
jgi:hypothetical protein